MIEERAVIVGMRNDADPSTVLLEIERQQACGLCGQMRGCGNKVWGQLFKHQQGQFLAKNTIQAQIGESVIVAIEEQSVMRAALLLYLLPVVAMLVLASVSTWIFSSELAALSGAVVGVLLSWIWVKHFLAVRPHGFALPDIVRLATEPCITIYSHQSIRESTK